MNKKKAIEDVYASLDQIEESVNQFHKGNKSFYRSVAVQLRLLLCNVSGRKGLIKRIFSQSAFHPLRGNLPHELQESLVLYSPALTQFDGKGNAKIESLFNISGKPLFTDDWLQQPLLTLGITIEELIRSVADKEGAHSDPDYNDTLKFTKSISIGVDSLHSQYIIAIGEYVASQLEIIFRELAEQTKHWENS